MKFVAPNKVQNKVIISIRIVEIFIVILFAVFRKLHKHHTSSYIVTSTSKDRSKNKHSRKRRCIKSPNTLSYPRTMMIKNSNTYIANSTVFRPCWFYYFACSALIIFCKYKRVIILLSFFYFFLHIFLGYNSRVNCATFIEKVTINKKRYNANCF